MKFIYPTGNKKMDEAILRSLHKGPGHLAEPELIKTLSVVEPVNKYHVAEKNDRTYKDGTVFASKREMERWDYLLRLQAAGEIKELERQVPFQLQESFIHRQRGDVGHILYVADFVYINVSYRKGIGQRKCVEDSKGGVLTNEYKLKKKLFLYRYGDLLFYEV